MSGDGNDLDIIPDEPTFEQFLENNNEVVGVLRYISEKAARRYNQDEHSVYSKLCDVLKKRWNDVQSAWQAFACGTAWRIASSLARKKNPVIDSQTIDKIADDRESPLEKLILDEEREFIEERVKELDPQEQEILKAYKDCKSMREAAKKLRMPESTYRKKFWENIDKIRPPE